MNHALKYHQAAEAASCSPHRVRIPAKIAVEASGKKEHAANERNSGARKFKLMPIRALSLRRTLLRAGGRHRSAPIELTDNNAMNEISDKLISFTPRRCRTC